MTTTTTTDEVMGYLDEVRIHLEDAIHAAQQAAWASRSGNGPHWLHGQLEAYLIPHLDTWLDSERQPGSVAGLQRGLEDWQAAEDHCEWCGEPADDELGPVTNHVVTPPVAGYPPAAAMMHAECATSWAKEATR